MSQGIEEIAAFDADTRSELFSESASQKGMKPAAVEKDFWICWALNRIFTDHKLRSQLIFKGGTSLSKCYNLIERFSEDIDLILDWRLITDDDPYEQRSNTQQDKFNKAMEQSTQSYVGETLLPHLNELFGGYGISIKPNNPKSLLLHYPAAFSSGYLKPTIELEFGAMSAMIPNDEFKIRPYCENSSPASLGDLNVTVRSIEAIKTFWDKVTILHCEAHRPPEKKQPLRYSRHYYDLFRLLKSHIKTEALANRKLLQSIFEFKHKFYPQGFAKYQEAINGQVKLVPPRPRIEQLEADYQGMREMIFGDYPAWTEIMRAIIEFEHELE